MIQPHGLLLVLEKPGLIIRRASENALDLVGTPAAELIDRPLEALAGVNQIARLRLVLRRGDLIRTNPLRVRLPDRPEGRVFSVLMHTVDEAIVFEAEPVASEDQVASNAYFQNACFQEVREATSRIQATESQEALCQVAAEELRRITGFDRVMMYRFDADWNGSVIAESRDDGTASSCLTSSCLASSYLASSYLGLQFPASDIPAQARRLYTLKRVGCIPDVRYTPVRLRCGNSLDSELRAPPLDMTHCVLRSVSPLHLEYLRNMGVGSTLTVSLLFNGVLWGMITCHHYQPKLVNPERRLSCSFLAQIIETQLGVREEGMERSYRMQTAALQVRFIELLSRAGSLGDLATDPASVMEFVDATGAIIVNGSTYALVGQTPDEAEIAGLIDRMKQSIDSGIYTTQSLTASYPRAERFKDVASGMLAVEISRERGDYIVWLRNERVHTIDWAGNPDKAVRAESGTARLHPRNSFELWKSAVTRHSKRWKVCEVAAAAELRDTIRSVLASDEERNRELRQHEQELRSSRDKAEAANSAKSEFLANMSHELRTPLTAILGYTELLSETDGPAVTDADRVDYIKPIQRDGDHLLAVINDILDISKIEAGRMSVETIPVSPVQLLLDVESLMQGAARSKGLSFTTTWTTPIPAAIQSDPIRMKQILVNLVGNAIKFTERGGISVRVSLAENAVSAPALRLEVVDSGIGMTPQQMEHLFAAFVQADATTVRKYGGTGLGLRISHSLARLLGGDVTVESEAGRGTTFTMMIPTGPLENVPMVNALAMRRSTSSDAPSSKSLQGAEPLEGVRIILAEDGPDNQRLFAHHLPRAGAELIVFANGRLALEAMTKDGTIEGPLLDEPACDLVLTDLHMPEMDGYTFARKLRNKGWTQHIIALTADAMAGERERCLQAGCDGYVSKPIDRKKLISTCCDALALSTA